MLARPCLGLLALQRGGPRTKTFHRHLPISRVEGRRERRGHRRRGGPRTEIFSCGAHPALPGTWTPLQGVALPHAGIGRGRHFEGTGQANHQGGRDRRRAPVLLPRRVDVSRHPASQGRLRSSKGRCGHFGEMGLCRSRRRARRNVGLAAAKRTLRRSPSTATGLLKLMRKDSWGGEAALGASCR